MEAISILFIALSVITIGYIYYISKNRRRIHLIAEIFFICIYTLILAVMLFPSILTLIETIFGDKSGLNFIIYLSIFVAYFLIFLLYNKVETQRQDITKLTREFALLKKKK